MVEPETGAVASPVGVAGVILCSGADVDFLHIPPVEGGVGLEEKSSDTGDDGSGR